MEFQQHFTWIPHVSIFLIWRLHYISLFGLLLLLFNFTKKLLLHFIWFKYDKKGIVICIVIIVLMVIQNKIILPQFAYTEHIYKKPEVLLKYPFIVSNQHWWNLWMRTWCTEIYMKKSERRWWMNSGRHKWMPAEIHVGTGFWKFCHTEPWYAVFTTIFEIFEQHINIRTTYFITGMQAKWIFLCEKQYS